MKRIFSVFTVLSIVLALTGCTQLMLNRREIDTIFNTRIVAIDIQGKNKVLYTIATKAAATGSGQQSGSPGGSESSNILVSEGSTVFEAARNMMEYSHKRPHYGHTEFIIFGEDTAREGILPYLDFISRNQEFRYNAKIYIVQGLSAKEFVSSANLGTTYLADRLSLLEDNAPGLSISGKVTLSEALFILSQENVSTYLPIVALIPTAPGEDPSQGPYDILLKGYAIFKEDRLDTILDQQLSFGVNLVKNRVKSGIILVEVPDNQKVSLEIVQCKTAIKPYIDDNGLQCTINIKFNTNIAETMSPEKIYDIGSFDYLKQQQEKQIKESAEKILSYAQEKDMDIFGILSNFRIRYPMMKDELSENWTELFPEIKFNVEVDSKINRAYLINDSVNSK